MLQSRFSDLENDVTMKTAEEEASGDFWVAKCVALFPQWPLVSVRGPVLQFLFS